MFLAGREGGQGTDGAAAVGRRPPFALEVRRLLVVDDDPTILKIVTRMLSVLDVAVVGAGSMDEAIEAASAQQPELAVVDVFLRGRADGIEVIAALRRRFPDVTVGAVSGCFGDAELEARCREAGATWCLPKPFNRAQLIDAIVAHGVRTPPMLRVDQPLRAIKDEYIERVLQSKGGSKSATAIVLGVSRQSLQARSKQQPTSQPQPTLGAEQRSPKTPASEDGED